MYYFTVNSIYCVIIVVRTTIEELTGRAQYYLIHRSDSIQSTDYIATPIQGFLGQKWKI